MKQPKPNNKLPLLPPKFDFENKEVLKKCIIAHRYLGTLNGIFTQLPNVDILLNNIVLNEAKDSSEIENIVTTLDELYKGNISEETSNSITKEVLNYKRGLYLGFELIKKKKIITTNIICEIQKKIENNNAGVRKTPGTKLINNRTGKIVYMPPEGEDEIRKLFKNLEDYINIDDEIDFLIKLAVIHYQFESIHPFYDGNGRTGRILNVLFVVQKELLKYPILFLSHYIFKNKGKFYNLFEEVRNNNKWNEWVIFFLDGIVETSKLTINMVEDIISLQKEINEYCKMKMTPRSYSKELIENLFFQPYTKTELIVQKLDLDRRTASKYLNELVSLGVLRKEKHWKENIYINSKLFDILNTSFK